MFFSDGVPQVKKAERNMCRSAFCRQESGFQLAANPEKAKTDWNANVNKMSKYKHVYVACPANVATGGPDALHQMAYYLNQIGVTSGMAYYGLSDSASLDIPEQYREYHNHYVMLSDVKDDENIAVVLPEVLIDNVPFKKAHVFIWWLSVDNGKPLVSVSGWKRIFYLISYPLRVAVHYQYFKGHIVDTFLGVMRRKEYSFSKEKKNVSHLCASYYAYDYVSERSKRPVIKCIEPISKFFLDRYDRDIDLIGKNDREDVILYNPKKSGGFIGTLRMKNSHLKFVALEKMSQEELVLAYEKAKLYIDFGPFPGAERMPKEAVLFGCAVITGTHGASGYHGDVPIPDSYKFINETEQTDEVLEKINETLEKYREVCHEFDEYRNRVLELESGFITALKDVFL